jgi:Flp pilus assembly protein TadD
MRFLMFIVLVPLAACAGQGRQEGAGAPPSDMKVADAAISAGSPAIALRIAEGMLATDPRNTGALLRQGRAYMQVGNTAAAETSYRRALAIDGRLDEARLGLAKIWLATDPVQAEKVLLEVLAHDAHNTAALNNLGVSRDLQGRHAEAQEAYQQALQYHPGLASAQENLGLSLALSGKPQEGAAMLDQLAKDGTSDRKVRDDLAVALTLSGRTGEAGQVLQEELSAPDVNKALAGYRALQQGAPAQ